MDVCVSTILYACGCVWMADGVSDLRCEPVEDGDGWNVAHDINCVADSPLVDETLEILAMNLFLPHGAITYVRTYARMQ